MADAAKLGAGTGSTAARCRYCAAELRHVFVDLGLSPLCQTQIAPGELDAAETFYPLRVLVCEECFLVQLQEYVAPHVIFSESYPYYSSYSESWLEHARAYVEHVTGDLGIARGDFVVELASNDGYLLQYFVERGIRCLGIEPAEGVASAAVEKGVPTLAKFFGSETAREARSVHGAARLILGNNVLAHVPDLNDFVAGIAALLADDGFGTFEFPHLMRLMESNQFDTIYHEHFSYFSLSTVRQVFAAHGMRIFDVRELDTHGGSLRIYVCHERAQPYSEHARVAELLERELQQGFGELQTYLEFPEKVAQAKRSLLGFLIEAKREGKSVVGYGAPGKGNTLLNYCGIRTDFLDYTVDRNPHKQGTYTPGTRIPILDPSAIFESRPDYLLILPWNLAAEIVESMQDVRSWGCRFVVPIPETRVLD